MASYSSLSSAILTYKGKILLLGADIISLDRLQKNLWRFIDGEKTGRESEDKAIARRVKYITRLDLKNIHRLEKPSENKKNCLYHAELTDQEVNSMERRDGHKLEFYTLRELEKLTLTDTTAIFLEEYKNAVEEVLVRKVTLQM